MKVKSCSFDIFACTVIMSFFQLEVQYFTVEVLKLASSNRNLFT